MSTIFNVDSNFILSYAVSIIYREVWRMEPKGKRVQRSITLEQRDWDVLNSYLDRLNTTVDTRTHKLLTLSDLIQCYVREANPPIMVDEG